MAVITERTSAEVRRGTRRGSVSLVGADADRRRVVRQTDGVQDVQILAEGQLGERPRIARVAQTVTDRAQAADVEAGLVGLGLPQPDEAATQVRLVDEVAA